MGQFFNSINQVAKNYKPYDDWEQRQADERAKKEYLATNTNIPQDKLDLIQKKAETVVRATEIMDARSEDNCENMEQYTGMVAMLPMMALVAAEQPIMALSSKLLGRFYDNKINKLRSELTNIAKDTPEYLEKNLKLEKLIKKSENAFRRGGIYGAVAVIALTLGIGISAILWGNKKQKEASRIGRFQAKRDNLQGLENFVVYTPEQLKQAEEIAKNIPDEKDRNSFMKMVKELKAVSKDRQAYKDWFKAQDPEKIEKLKQLNYTPEQLIKGEEDKELIVDTVKEINIKAEEYSENLENAFDTMSTLSWLLTIPAGIGINKILKSVNAPKKIKTAISFLTPFFISLGIMMSGTVEQKKASRVGRYQARKDILKNPARLLAYSDDEMKKAEHIKADKQKKSFFSKLGQNFKFLGTYYKDKREYNKYKKTTQKENEKLQKAFKEIEITEEQKADAKNLQRNVFRAFDEIDEMSQRYSEDVEAGCEIAKTLGNTAWEMAVMVGTTVLGVSVAKGKFPIAKIVNGITNMVFKKESSIRVAVNNLYDVLKQDKTLMKDFQKALVRGDMKYFMKRSDTAKVTEAIEPVINEFVKVAKNGLTAVKPENAEKMKLTTVLGNLFNDHLKQGKFAKWARNMLGEISKLWMKSKTDKIGIELPTEAAEKLGLNFNYKNYKTMINTGALAGIPVLGVIFSIPYAFNSWLTNIQKKAGKIGIMKAMDKIDDSRVFAPDEVSAQPQKQEDAQDTNLLARFRK